MLQKNIVDVTFPLMARTYARDIVGEPTPVFSSTPMVILGGRNETESMNMQAYLLTFDTQIWILLLLVLALVSLLCAALHKYDNEVKGVQKSLAKLWNLYFWDCLGVMFAEVPRSIPRNIMMRLLFGTWLLTILVLVNAFAGQMSACLMVKTKTPKVNSIADIARRPYLKVYTLKHSEVTRYLNTRDRPAERQVWAMVRRDKSEIPSLYRYPENMMTEVVQARAVVIMPEQMSLTQVNRYCKRPRIGEFYFGDTYLFSHHYGVYMRRGLPQKLRHRLSEVVSRLEQSGIVRHYHSTKLSPIEQCCGHQSRTQLNFSDMVSVFYLYAACCLVAVLVLVAELIAASRIVHTHLT
ncbi:glutamate receptor 2-like isoform X2 [Dermacentor albipictus]